MSVERVDQAGRRRIRPRWAAARAAVARGWPVFPLVPYGKRPAVRGWQQRASCDPDAVEGWWRSVPFNVGIACGPAGLVVLDLDDGGGQVPPGRWAGRGVSGGVDVLGLLAAEQDVVVPATFTVATPGGGQHRYFTVPAGVEVRNSAGVVGWRVDVRAAGGYVVAAGSVCRVGGRSRLYRVVDPRPPVPLPGWIAAAVTRRQSRPVVVGAVPGGSGRGAWVAAAVAGESRAVRDAGVGRRNTAVFAAACRLGELVGAGVLDEQEAVHALRDAALVHVGVDGFTVAEADRAIGNGLARGRAHPRRLDPGRAG